MNFLDIDKNADLRPGLILGMPDPEPVEAVEIRTDVACFLRVRHSAEELEFLPGVAEDEPGAIKKVFVADLPGSPDGDVCTFRMTHHELDSWVEDAFRGEFRTRHSAGARLYFENGGRRLHLVDVDFWIPPFDPSQLHESEDPEAIAEERLEAGFLAFYNWALERLDDFGKGEINQIAVPELWTSHVHLLPEVWAMIACYCRVYGNRFLLADSAPPLAVLQQAEQVRAAAHGYTLSEDEVTAAALVPWFRPEQWAHREDVPVEVALTLDALHATKDFVHTGGTVYPRDVGVVRPDLEKGRTPSREEREILSCFGLYWPWVQSLRGVALPPSAAIGGVYARSDEENAPVGVRKPPANERVKAIMDLALHVDERPQNLLRREGVNLLQQRVGKGIVVWGARTQCEDELWRFVNVRRLIGYIGKQIQVDNQWAVFENNTGDLRATVARDVRYFLQDMWQKGALAGETAEHAFRVVCTEENNPTAVVDQGILVVDVWVNPVQTNEFVHLQLTYGDALVE